jgi:BirA family biotin operon repressor/biotin-[acetyl-CoA-carboxylase] ligase
MYTKHVYKMQPTLIKDSYTIVCPSKSPIPWKLRQHLRTKLIGKRIYFFKEIGSTQDLAVSLAEKDMKDLDGTVIISERQKNGRGRIGKRWISPKGGIWLSVILKPKIAAAFSPVLSCVAAIAVCDTVNEKTKLRSNIKWPNDIVIRGRKVSGVLVDLSAEAENVNYAVIGIGINANVNNSRIISQVCDIKGLEFFGITSLKSELGEIEVNIPEIILLVLQKLEYYYMQLNRGYYREIIGKWKDNSETLDNLVVIKRQNEIFEGIAVDVDVDGGLLVKSADGNTHRVISSPDVIVRKKFSQDEIYR